MKPEEYSIPGFPPGFLLTVAALLVATPYLVDLAWLIRLAIRAIVRRIR